MATGTTCSLPRPFFTSTVIGTVPSDATIGASVGVGSGREVALGPCIRQTGPSSFIVPASIVLKRTPRMAMSAATDPMAASATANVVISASTETTQPAAAFGQFGSATR